tara:strand:+ start:470 stop:703 length:234 start_codon:yes stop_codon:yes gene_type:complete
MNLILNGMDSHFRDNKNCVIRKYRPDIARIKSDWTVVGTVKISFIKIYTIIRGKPIMDEYKIRLQGIFTGSSVFIFL